MDYKSCSKHWLIFTYTITYCKVTRIKNFTPTPFELLYFCYGNLHLCSSSFNFLNAPVLFKLKISHIIRFIFFLTCKLFPLIMLIFFFGVHNIIIFPEWHISLGYSILQFFQDEVVGLMLNPQPDGSGFDFGVYSPREVGNA